VRTILFASALHSDKKMKERRRRIESEKKEG